MAFLIGWGMGKSGSRLLGLLWRGNDFPCLQGVWIHTLTLPLNARAPHYLVGWSPALLSTYNLCDRRGTFLTCVEKLGGVGEGQSNHLLQGECHIIEREIERSYDRNIFKETRKSEIMRKK